LEREQPTSVIAGLTRNPMKSALLLEIAGQARNDDGFVVFLYYIHIMARCRRQNRRRAFPVDSPFALRHLRGPLSRFFEGFVALLTDDYFSAFAYVSSGKTSQAIAHFC